MPEYGLHLVVFINPGFVMFLIPSFVILLFLCCSCVSPAPHLVTFLIPNFVTFLTPSSVVMFTATPQEVLDVHNFLNV